MSSQTFFAWIVDQAIPIVVIFCCLITAYLIYARAFRRRVLPILMNRRVAEALSPSGSRSTVTASGSRPAISTSAAEQPTSELSS